MKDSHGLVSQLNACDCGGETETKRRRGRQRKTENGKRGRERHTQRQTGSVRLQSRCLSACRSALHSDGLREVMTHDNFYCCVQSERAWRQTSWQVWVHLPIHLFSLSSFLHSGLLVCLPSCPSFPPRLCLFSLFLPPWLLPHQGATSRYARLQNTSPTSGSHRMKVYTSSCSWWCLSVVIVTLSYKHLNKKKWHMGQKNKKRRVVNKPNIYLEGKSEQFPLHNVYSPTYVFLIYRQCCIHSPLVWLNKTNNWNYLFMQISWAEPVILDLSNLTLCRRCSKSFAFLSVFVYLSKDGNDMCRTWIYGVGQIVGD